MLSIRTRLLLASSGVVAGFFGLTAWALDEAFRDSAQAAFQERLQGHIYALLAAAELRNGRLWLPEVLPEARFSTVGSGLYAQVQDKQQILWRSASLVGLHIPTHWQAHPMQGTFEYVRADAGSLVYQLNFGVIYEDESQQAFPYTFSVAESLDAYYQQVGVFRQSLGGWLIGGALVLLAVQTAVLRWALKPLQQVTGDLNRIEKGQQPQLLGHYPYELLGLTNNLNALLKNERLHLQRYRNTLGDLAHSLKTPLAVLQGILDLNRMPADSQQAAQEQVQRMRQLVEYQLQRAMTSGRVALNPPVNLPVLMDQLIASLKKVYWHKPIHWEMHINPAAGFYGEEGDLMEVVGNLLDNACKWCHSQIHIQIEPIVGQQRNGLWLQVDDDGKGIAEEQKYQLLQRGIRGDVAMSGHGIGLAILQDIVDVYGGGVNMDKSVLLGGASFVVRLPAE